tara:strand:- start:1651 stop:1962 length:312 start_codon:yes stop_codon:yes gene_type:complete
MTQVSQITLDNQSFSTFRSNLNLTIQALNSNHLGASRPTSAVAGTLWIDNSGTNTYALKVFDGTDDFELFSMNTLTNVITLPSGVIVDEADPNSIPFAVALGS